MSMHTDELLAQIRRALARAGERVYVIRQADLEAAIEAMDSPGYPPRTEWYDGYAAGGRWAAKELRRLAKELSE